MPRVGKTMDRRRNQRRRQLSGAHSAESWNRQYPVGILVHYYPIYPPLSPPGYIEVKTRSQAWDLGDGTAVVLIEGRTGGVALSHILVPAKESK